MISCIMYHNNKGGDIMKKAAGAKKVVTKTGSQVYLSKYKCNAEYNKNSVDNIALRLPKGYKEKMKDYVASSGKYESVNSMIVKLIENELNISG